MELKINPINFQGKSSLKNVIIPSVVAATSTASAATYNKLTTELDNMAAQNVVNAQINQPQSSEDIIISRLQTMVDNGEKYRAAEMPQKVGFAKNTIRKYRAKNPEIEALYQKVLIPYKQPIKSPKIYENIMILLAQKIENRQKVSLNSIASELNITKAQICCRLKRSEKLRTMYDQIKLTGSLCRPYKRKNAELEREEQIKTLLLQLKEGEKISIDAIAERLNLPLHQVVTSIYSKKSNIRELFDSVKKFKNMHVSDGYKEHANKIIEHASQYNVTEPNNEFVDNNYNNYLAYCLARIKMTDNAVEAFSELFKKYPGFANDLLTHKSNPKNRRLKDTKSDKNIQYFYNAYEINPELTEKLTFEVDKNGKYKYSPSEVFYKVKFSQYDDTLYEKTKDQTKFVDYLLDMKNNDGNPRFSISEIIKLSEINEKQSEILNLAIERKESDSNEYSYKYKQIINFIKFYKEEPELALELLDSKIEYQNKYSNYSSQKIIDEYFDAERKCDTSKKDLIINLIKKYENLSTKLSPQDISFMVLNKINYYNKKLELYNQIIGNNDVNSEKLLQFLLSYGFDDDSIIKSLNEIGKKPENIKKLKQIFKTDNDINKILYEYNDAMSKNDTFKQKLIKNLVEQVISDNGTMDISLEVLDNLKIYNTQKKLIDKIKNNDNITPDKAWDFFCAFGFAKMSVIDGLKSIGINSKEAEKIYKKARANL